MKRVIITGASGMIGGLILQNCLERNNVSQVTSFVRCSSGIVHPKLKEIIHTDYLNYAAVEEHLKNQDVCFYCIGVYTGQVPKNEFEKITVEYTRTFAEALKKNSPGATFCFLSGEGADSKETSKILFARAKGIAENILVNLKFGATYIFRPGYIYPVTPRKEPNLAYSIMRFLYKYFLSKVSAGIGVTSVHLANTITDIGLNGGSKVIYENSDIRMHVQG